MKKRVLIVEDTPSEREMIRHYLTESGYEVVSAENGKEALVKIAEQMPDVVLTDLVMPDMSGLELCRSLKKSSQTEKIPVIACTTKDQELDKLWGMKQGIDLYLTKPFTKEDIVRAVKSFTG
jgi:two-component system, chemotaxis family, response regulator PixH